MIQSTGRSPWAVFFFGCFCLGKPTTQHNYSAAAAFAEFLPNIHCLVYGLSGRALQAVTAACSAL
ncbi:MAG: hypothetical protein DWI22_13365 [Planctomycetota bacterium]|nr:MAG: hypothetical protein DWI22_13365 [Planctomycetota bacterium]